MISIQRFEPIYGSLKNQVSLNRLADELPDMFVGTDPVGVFQYGHDVYEKRQQRKEDPQTPQSTFTSSAVNPQLCGQNCGCSSCR
ncbi:MAG: hypothetical protein ACK5T0_08020 [Vampirovibrionales bacterium]